MGADIPQPFVSTISGSLGSVGPVSVAGIPDTYHIHLEKLPKIEMKLDPVEIKPLDLNISLREVPSQRMHLPADFSVGLSLFGIDIMCMRLCGEGQVINEPYVPNPCERCGGEKVEGPRRVARPSG